MRKSTGMALALLLSCCMAAAQAKPNKNNQPAKSTATTAPAATATPIAATGFLNSEPPPPKTTVVEQVVARVNDKIITSTDLAQAQNDLLQSLQAQAQQSGQPVSQTQVDAAQKDLLANLIDNQLLQQRASDLGMSAETETILRLDQMRKQNHLASMEDLQKAVESQGESYQDFEQSIKNQILQQKVIEEDVAPRIPPSSPAQVEAYYNAHKGDFMRPDEVQLSEILIKTDNAKTPAEKKRLQELADQVQQRAAAGEDFAKMAQKYSNAASAQDGGDIGFQQKKQLEAKLAATLFALPVGGVTPVEEVPNGWLILKVTAVHHAGQESLADANNEIQNVLYQQALRPEMQTYLAKLRQQAYIRVKKGYTDTGAVASLSPDITKFQRVLPSDLPKPTDKPKTSGINLGGGGQ